MTWTNVDGMGRTSSQYPLAERAVEDTASTSVVVCELVSQVSETPVRELPPLQGAIDSDGLDAVITTGRSRASVAFEFAGYEVVARPNSVELYRGATVTD